jgi:hypothetical protein
MLIMFSVQNQRTEHLFHAHWGGWKDCRLPNEFELVWHFALPQERVSPRRRPFGIGFLCKDIEYRDLCAAIKGVWSGKPRWAEPDRVRKGRGSLRVGRSTKKK